MISAMKSWSNLSFYESEKQNIGLLWQMHFLKFRENLREVSAKESISEKLTDQQ